MPDRSDIDALHGAVMRRSLPELAAAISAGAEVNARDRDGRSAAKGESEFRPAPVFRVKV